MLPVLRSKPRVLDEFPPSEAAWMPPESGERLTAMFDAVVRAYPAELAVRRVEKAQVRVFDAGGTGGPLFPAGSLLVATGHPGSGLFADLAAAGVRGDAKGVSDVIDRIRRAQENSVAPVRSAGFDPVAALSQVDTYGQVSYGGRVIAHAQVVTPDVPVSVLHIPFSGGALPVAGFVANHFHRVAESRAETFVIVRQPDCTDLEKRVMLAFPEVNADELVAASNPEANWLVAAAVVGVVGAGVAGAYYFARRAQQAVRDQAAEGGETIPEGLPETVPETLPSERVRGEQWLAAPVATQVSGVATHPAASNLIDLRTHLLKGKRIG